MNPSEPKAQSPLNPARARISPPVEAEVVPHSIQGQPADYTEGFAGCKGSLHRGHPRIAGRFYLLWWPEEVSSF